MFWPLYYSIKFDEYHNTAKIPQNMDVSYWARIAGGITVIRAKDEAKTFSGTVETGCLVLFPRWLEMAEDGQKNGKEEFTHLQSSSEIQKLPMNLILQIWGTLQYCNSSKFNQIPLEKLANAAIPWTPMSSSIFCIVAFIPSPAICLPIYSGQMQIW